MRIIAQDFLSLLELSPRQREVKKDYKLSQARKNNPVPSFEEIWEHLKVSDGVSHYIEGWMMDFDEDDGDFDEREAELLQQAKEEAEETYFRVLWEYERMNGEPCFRCVTLPKGVNPLTHPQLGNYWATDESKADCHWGNFTNTTKVLYRGRIAVENIDWGLTLHNRLDFDLGEEEAEISFLRHAPIFVEGATIYPDSFGSGTYHEIGEMRRC